MEKNKTDIILEKLKKLSKDQDISEIIAAPEFFEQLRFDYTTEEEKENNKILSRTVYRRKDKSHSFEIFIDKIKFLVSDDLAKDEFLIKTEIKVKVV